MLARLFETVNKQYTAILKRCDPVKDE